MKPPPAADGAGRHDWPVGAARLLTALPPETWHPAARAFLEQRPASEVWVIACSGGADSLALLLLVWAACPERRTQLRVGHFDHALREGSSVDAAWVGEVAQALGLPCSTARWERTAGTARETVSEADAREARLGFLHGVLADAPGGVLLTGHHADDVAETLLMRLGQGSGLEGLAAPRPVQPYGTMHHVRPLLSLRRAALREALSALGLPWREDPSNAGGVYTRNRLRHQLLPAWEALQPQDLVPNLIGVREHLERCDAALSTWEAQAWRALEDNCAVTAQSLETTALAPYPLELRRRLLRRWLTRLAGLPMPAARPFTQLVALCERATAEPREVVQLGPGITAGLRGTCLTLEQASPPTAQAWGHVRLLPGALLCLPDGARLRCEALQLDQKQLDAILGGHVEVGREAWLHPATVTALEASTWRPGDAYRPLGAPGRRKLQDCFVDARVPRLERHRRPVVRDRDGGPVWVPGLPPAHDCRLKAGAASALRLTYRPGSAHT